MRTINGAILAVLLAATNVFAAPPDLSKLPPEVRPAGQYAILHPDTDAVAITYVGLDGLDAFPSELLRDPKTFVIHTRGLPTGRYRFAAVASSKEGDQARRDFSLVIGDAPVPPVPPPDVPVPPAPPVPSYYFLIVRKDGPADPSFTKVMEDASWSELVTAGHTYKPKTVTEAAALGVRIAPGTKLPVVVTLRVAADGRSSTIVRDAIPLPTTSDGIRNLPEGVK